MIIHGFLTVIVIATMATGAIITGPTTTRMPPQEINHAETTAAAATASATASANDVTPIVKSTVSKLHKPLITCLCNLHKCTSNTINGKDGKDGTCTTRLGCFSEIRSVLPPVEETSKPTNATPTQPPMTDNGSAVLPNIPEAFDAETTAHVEGPSSTRASYGCLDKQPCDEILRSMESDASEFPVIQAPTNAALPPNNALVLAFHCCQTPKCNGNHSGPAESSVKSAKAVLAAALRSALALNEESKSEIRQNSSAEMAVDPATIAAEEFPSLTSQTSKEIVIGTGPVPAVALGEPRPPSALKSEISEDTGIGSTVSPEVQPVMPEVVPPIPVQQEITHNTTVEHLEHVVAKRHDSQRVESAMKLSTDDQENIGDFDDDIAAEVRAAAATAKSIPMSDQKNAKSPWAPRHDGVPEFVPPPVLQKDNDSYLPNYANNNYINDDAVMNNWMIGITCAIVLACLVGLSLLIMSVVRIIRKSDVFKNYKGVCSNPGQPCACNGGLTRRRPRTQPSSSDLDAAVAAVQRTSTTAPLLPPPNKYRGRGRSHANAAATYNDAMGDTTYVFTAIPVSDEPPLTSVIRRM
ncbi:Uncharacterized protein FWK35_00021257 [Aphis craccivora]|uniref:Uncharacterized protein n=1 Tax=Aphis craccivora TaxID=307492 RepID=A0A6G0ZE60_APHCR|nr:Uncharacterized protein FWK35_00021257 [Aphis craccivora]